MICNTLLLLHRFLCSYLKENSDSGASLFFNRFFIHVVVSSNELVYVIRTDTRDENTTLLSGCEVSLAKSVGHVYIICRVRLHETFSRVALFTQTDYSVQECIRSVHFGPLSLLYFIGASDVVSDHTKLQKVARLGE